MRETKRKTNIVIVTIAIFVATFMTAIEGTIVSTAMPTIVGDLHGMELMNWIFSIYLLTNAMMTPIYGKLSDRVGRKPVFIAGLVMFVIGSSLCGLSHNMMTLILSRAIQGIGAGAIMPVSFTMIADIYPFEKRAKVLGFNGSAWGIASIIAPLLGGFIVDKLSWHWIFFINVPIGIITILLIQFYFYEEKREKRDAPIDFLGSIFIVIMLLAIMYGFQILGSEGNHVVMILILLVVAILSFLGFLRTERKAKDPIIALKLFNNRTFVIQNLVAALVSGFLMGFEVYMPMWMQGILGLPASMGGFAVTPSSVLWILGSFVAGQLVVKYPPKKILFGSLIILLVGSIVLGLVPMSTPFWFFLMVAAFLGMGFGITITTTTVTAQNVVPEAEIGVATSINTLSRTLGQTLMVSIYGIVLNTQLNKGVSQTKGATSDQINQLINPQTATELPAKLLPALRHILYEGLHWIYFVSVFIIIIAVIVNLLDHSKKTE